VDAVTAFISTVAPFVILIVITIVATVSMMRSNRKHGAAERARNEREAQNERVVPLPSAGSPDDKDGEITIHLKRPRR
jgi:hypothetical protein